MADFDARPEDPTSQPVASGFVPATQRLRTSAQPRYSARPVVDGLRRAAHSGAQDNAPRNLNGMLDEMADSVDTHNSFSTSAVLKTISSDLSSGNKPSMKAVRAQATDAFARLKATLPGHRPRPRS